MTAQEPPRGFHPWRPQRKTLAILGQVEEILHEYEAHLPLTIRQVFYRLVGKFEYPKEEKAYERLAYLLVRARRARMIPFETIRDDGVQESIPRAHSSPAAFWDEVMTDAREFRLDRQEGQASWLEVWCEAGGMVPQMENVAHPYGIPVYSSGGYDSLSTKYQTAQRILSRERSTVILSVGDLDPSGQDMYDVFTGDVAAFVEDMGGTEGQVRGVRVAVTREQVEKYALPQKPPKANDRRRREWHGGTVQAEALPPSALAAELRAQIVARLDLGIRDALLEREKEARSQVIREVRGVEPY